MKKQTASYTNRWLALVIAVVTMGSISRAWAYPITLIQDTFTTNSPSRNAGSTLSGTVTEIGAKTWNNSLPMVFGSDSAIHQTEPTAFYSAFVPFVPSNPATPGTWLQLQADVHSVGSLNANDFIALGFFNSSQGTANDLLNHQLWVLLSQAGNYVMFANGVTDVLGTGVAPNYNPNGFNNLWIEYHGDSNTVALRINNVPITLGTNDLDTVGFTPPIANVGFTMLRQTSAGAVDNFQLFLVPEPTTVALVLGSFALLCRRRSR